MQYENLQFDIKKKMSTTKKLRFKCTQIFALKNKKGKVRPERLINLENKEQTFFTSHDNGNTTSFFQK